MRHAACALGVAPNMTRYLAFHAATAEGVVDASPLPSAPLLCRAWRQRFPDGDGRRAAGKRSSSAAAASSCGRLVLLVRLWTDELRRCVMSATIDDGGITRLAYVQARACARPRARRRPSFQVRREALVSETSLVGPGLGARPSHRRPRPRS